MSRVLAVDGAMALALHAIATSGAATRTATGGVWRSRCQLGIGLVEYADWFQIDH